MIWPENQKYDRVCLGREFLLPIFFQILFHVGAYEDLRIPFDLRILRILLPAHTRRSACFLLLPSLSSRVCNTDSHTSNDLDLGDTMAVTQDNTDLRRGGTLSGEFADLVDDGFRRALEPGRH